MLSWFNSRRLQVTAARWIQARRQSARKSEGESRWPLVESLSDEQSRKLRDREQRRPTFTFAHYSSFCPLDAHAPEELINHRLAVSIRYARAHLDTESEISAVLLHHLSHQAGNLSCRYAVSSSACDNGSDSYYSLPVELSLHRYLSTLRIKPIVSMQGAHLSTRSAIAHCVCACRCACMCSLVIWWPLAFECEADELVWMVRFEG